MTFAIVNNSLETQDLANLGASDWCADGKGAYTLRADLVARSTSQYARSAAILPSAFTR